MSSEWESKAKEILAPLFNPEPHPFQEAWSEAHSMSGDTMVKVVADGLAKAFSSGLRKAAEIARELGQGALDLDEHRVCRYAACESVAQALIASIPLVEGAAE